MNHTQEKIITEALTLFNEKGFSNVTMREIASQAGIAVGNLTYYYHQKSDMIPDLMQTPAYLSKNPADSLESFFELIDEMLDALYEKRFFFRNNDLLNYNENFYHDYSDMQIKILQHLEANLARLAAEKILIPLDEKEIKAIARFMLSQHIVWVAGTLSPFKGALNKATVLLEHVYFMKHLVAKSHQDTLFMLKDKFKTAVSH